MHQHKAYKFRGKVLLNFCAFHIQVNQLEKAEKEAEAAISYLFKERNKFMAEFDLSEEDNMIQFEDYVSFDFFN